MAKQPVNRKTESEKTAAVTKTSTRLRSPNYPGVSLPTAVDFVRRLIEKDGKAGAPNDIALRHMGFSGPHGHARSVLSSLRKFGLIEATDTRVTPTELAITIVRFPDGHSRKRQALRTAALSPAIYHEIVNAYRSREELPSDESLRPEIETDWEFNPKAVPDFLTDFKASLVFAGLLEGNRLVLEDEPVASSTDPEGVSSQEEEPMTATTTQASVAPTRVVAQPVPTSNQPGKQSYVSQEDHFAGGPSIRFGLTRGNAVEIRMKSKVSPEEFEKVKRIFELSEIAFVEEIASISMILDQNLTGEEKAKLRSLEYDLSAAFTEFGKAVRVCRGVLKGNIRVVEFVEGFTGPVVMSFTSPEFLGLSNEILAARTHDTLSGRAD